MFVITTIIWRKHYTSCKRKSSGSVLGWLGCWNIFNDIKSLFLQMEDICWQQCNWKSTLEESASFFWSSFWWGGLQCLLQHSMYFFLHKIDRKMHLVSKFIINVYTYYRLYLPGLKVMVPPCFTIKLSRISLSVCTGGGIDFCTTQISFPANIFDGGIITLIAGSIISSSLI